MFIWVNKYVKGFLCLTGLCWVALLSYRSGQRSVKVRQSTNHVAVPKVAGYLNIDPEEQMVGEGEVVRKQSRKVVPKTREQSVEWKMKVRSMKVRKYCKTYGHLLRADWVKPDPIGGVRYVWDIKDNLIYCPIPKVASTTWMVNFLRLGGFNEGLSEELRFQKEYGATQSKVHRIFPAPETPGERRRVMKSLARLIIVRHPFSRLISAYRDKMLTDNPGPPIHYETQQKILREYRDPSDNTSGPYPTFPEFVRFVIEQSTGKVVPSDWDDVLCWKPYYVKCLVCDMLFTYIVKLENFDEEQNVVIKSHNLTHLLPVGDKRHANNQSSDSLLQQYFSQVTKAQIGQLYANYMHDFKLFDYDINDILKYGRE